MEGKNDQPSRLHSSKTSAKYDSRSAQFKAKKKNNKNSKENWTV